MEILNLKSHCGAFSWLPSSVYKLPHLSLQQVEHSLSGTFKHLLCNVANIWICNYVYFRFLWSQRSTDPQSKHCASWHCAAKLHDIDNVFCGLCLLRISLWIRVVGVDVVIVAPVGLGWTNWVTAGGGKADGGTRRWTEHGLPELAEPTKHTDPDIKGTVHCLEVGSLWFYEIFGVILCD